MIWLVFSFLSIAKNLVNSKLYLQKKLRSTDVTEPTENKKGRDAFHLFSRQPENRNMFLLVFMVIWLLFAFIDYLMLFSDIAFPVLYLKIGFLSVCSLFLVFWGFLFQIFKKKFFANCCHFKLSEFDLKGLFSQWLLSYKKSFPFIR